ncbi:MAG: hypothetical protein KAS32_06555 [Candidatus Peribacteraceae bacterium]|nr:hypothetical protein [Candidatus Peribacteraceae bacterium]
MEIERISRGRYALTIGWTVLLSICIIVAVSGLARATLNIKGALIEKPEIAIFLLLPDEGITHVEVLRETETTRDFLAHTEENGVLLVKMEKGETEWYITEKEQLH